ncbi:MAG: single-stranded-DNA-specific exonuclease RecJ [Anaerolineales bacterium]|jgi:single-stranded-DNA-specific exonuclease
MAHWIEPSASSGKSPLPGLHPLVAETLIRRGYGRPESARAFLDPAAYSPTPAADLPGLTAAADRLQQSIRAREPICVWGDFDVDGQTSTSILVSTLLALGAKVTYHIPIRAQESHGVNVPALTGIIDRGAKLILTCDTGITANEAVEYALSRGVEVIITDHHELPEILPPAAVLIDPKFLPREHPLASLSGSGVSYKLAEELLGRASSSPLAPDDLLDLAALGLVADLALLTGDARYLVQRGLEVLRGTHRLGLQIMLELSGVKPDHLSEEHIGFILGPRLNALGRLGDANPAVELLTTSDAGRARLIATQLEGLNTQRQLLTEQVTQAAEAQLQADPSLLAQPVLVLAHPTWPGGVIGIAASHLVDRYHRPAILFSTPAGEPAHGSARSIEGINITAAIAAQKDLLLNFGGHPMAAGLSLEQDKLPEFRARLARTVQEMAREVETEASLQVDAWLELPQADLELAEALETLAPFGPGNEKLVLATRDLTLRSRAAIGRNQEHLRLTLSDEAGNTQTVLWWDGAGEIMPEGRFDLAFTLRTSDWGGRRTAQLELVDYRIVEQTPVEIELPSLEVVDHRAAENPQAILASLPEGSLIWAEGEDKKGVGGKDRTELFHAETLAIWTIPPSIEILHAALRTVQPRRVILFAILPRQEEPREFLERLAGLAKFALNQRAGQASTAKMAAATAAREAAVRLGLEWLAAKGQLAVETNEGELHLGRGTPQENPYALGDLNDGLQIILDETRAYRTFYMNSETGRLLSLQN